MSNKSLLILNGSDRADFANQGHKSFPGITLSQIEKTCYDLSEQQGFNLDFRQIDNEEKMIRCIEKHSENVDAFIISPLAGSTTASSQSERFQKVILEMALQDKPVIEVYVKNIFRQDPKTNEPLQIPDSNMGFVCGLGINSYRLAIKALGQRLNNNNNLINPRQITPGDIIRKVFVINGPNINLLGTREPKIYGKDTLDDIASQCITGGKKRALDIEFMQSNSEGEMVDFIQRAIHLADALLINAGAYTHTSLAIHDALRAYQGLKIELHISNPHLREKFRHFSYVSLAVDGVVAGLGVTGYDLLIDALPGLH